MHSYLHQNNYTYGYLPYLTFCDYRVGSLMISIAINQNGLNENYNLKQIQNNRSTNNKPKDSNEMFEDWRDNNNNDNR